MKGYAVLLALTVIGVVGVYGVVPPPAKIAGVWTWAGCGGVALLAHFLGRTATGSAAVLLPSFVRLILWPVWIGGMAWYFSPSLRLFLPVVLVAIGTFLIAEVSLSLRNLRRPL
jgi:hypothetical protein